MKKLILSFAICFGIFVCQNGVAQSFNLESLNLESLDLQSTPITKQAITPSEGNATSEEVIITQTIPQISKLTPTSGGQSTTPEENIPNIVQTEPQLIKLEKQATVGNNPTNTDLLRLPLTTVNNQKKALTPVFKQ